MPDSVVRFLINVLLFSAGVKHHVGHNNSRNRKTAPVQGGFSDYLVKLNFYFNNEIFVGRMKRSASGNSDSYGNNAGSAPLDPAYKLLLAYT